MLHLSLDEIGDFLCKIPHALRDGGVAYISFKCGIVTGTDADGRFFTNISEQDVQHLIEKSTAISLVDMWSANYAQTECQFRYCGTAIPFLTVRSTAR